MITRRRTVQTGLATLLSAAAPFRAFAQPKPRAKVRYNEVVRSILYAPAYVAIAKGYFEEARHRRHADDRPGRRQVAWRSCSSNQADIALIGPETAIYVQNSDSADQDSDLLRAHRHRRLHAGRPREGRQVRLEHAQGQGNPRLPPRQHAAPVSRGGAAPERARSAEGREAHEQRRDPGARRAPGSPARTSTPSSSSRTPRSSSSTARRTSSPRSARPSASPTTPPSWRPTSTSARTSRGDPELDQRDRQGA